MLSDCNVRPEIAVKDLAAAKSFYGGTLGLKLLMENEEELLFQAGDSHVGVYRSAYAGTNKATYMSWECEDVEGAVEGLKGKGVSFEHYDMPGVTLRGDVHVMDGMWAAWFKDPDSNVLCIANLRAPSQGRRA